MTRSRISRRILPALAAALLTGISGTPALAQSPAAPVGSGSPEAPGRRGTGRTDGELWLMVRTANLTPEQQAKVSAILTAHRAGARPLIEQLRETQQELGARLLAPGQVQTGDIQPQLQRIGQLRDRLAQDSAQAALEVRAVLTPEQLAHVAQTKERIRQLRDEMFQLLQPGPRGRE
jgi:Spy/CpxP family protein refolding chaperone